MKPIYQKLIGCPDEGFAVKEIHGDDCNCSWHCHPEAELVLVLQSHGYRIVGDNIQSLQRGDLVLLGPNLPHAYQHKERLSRAQTPAHCVLLQFEEQFWAGMLDLPALTPVRRLLCRASVGLHIKGATRNHAAIMLQDMLKLRGLRRIGAFLSLLDCLSRSRTCLAIASSGFTTSLPVWEQERVDRIYQFIDQNYHRPLRLAEAARLAHMSEGAFSRFFRAHMGKTFPAFVNDLRIGRACRLLAETELPITEIALSCGYRNLSNFNRQFLHCKHLSPSDFRRRMQRLD
jgi:AraC-like DNA-binding protein